MPFGVDNYPGEHPYGGAMHVVGQPHASAGRGDQPSQRLPTRRWDLETPPRAFRPRCAFGSRPSPHQGQGMATTSIPDPGSTATAL